MCGKKTELLLIINYYYFQHVHVHIIPRQPRDILMNDDIYRMLQNEKNCTNPKRSDDEMAHEAKMLRPYFFDQKF